MFSYHVTATTDIYTLSLHDALPIWCDAPAHSGAAARHRDRSLPPRSSPSASPARASLDVSARPVRVRRRALRSEEHTSELQSLRHLVCRLLLEKKNNTRDADLSRQT